MGGSFSAGTSTGDACTQTGSVVQGASGIAVCYGDARQDDREARHAVLRALQQQATGSFTQPLLLGSGADGTSVVCALHYIAKQCQAAHIAGAALVALRHCSLF